MFIKLKSSNKQTRPILHLILRYLNQINQDHIKNFPAIGLKIMPIDILRLIKKLLIKLVQYLIFLSEYFAVKKKIKFKELDVYFNNYKKKKKIITKKINLSSEYKIFGNKKTYKSKNYFSNVYLYQIENAQVFGDTACVLVKNFLLFDGVQNLKAEHVVEEGFLNFKNLNSNFIANRYKNCSVNIDEAISLLNPLYFNYAHFVTEILPLIIFLKKSHNNTPILINNFKNKNILIFLKKLLLKYKVYVISEDQSIFVKKLFIFSKIAHVSHEPRYPNKTRVTQGIFSEPFFKGTNEYFREKNKKSLPIKKKIYVIRPRTYRYLLNEEIIISILKKAGYFILDPYKYSIKKQIFFFQNAQIIISPTGASLANLVFCLNKPKVIIFAPNLRMIFNYWRNLTYDRISNMTYIVGKKNYSNKFYHSNYSIIPDQLLNLIKR
jgi:hypothetical protein